MRKSGRTIDSGGCEKRAVVYDNLCTFLYAIAYNIPVFNNIGENQMLKTFKQFENVF